MLQIARERVKGKNRYVIGFDLKQFPYYKDERQFHWDSAVYDEHITAYPPNEITGIKLKPGEGPINIKIVRC